MLGSSCKVQAGSQAERDRNDDGQMQLHRVNGTRTEIETEVEIEKKKKGNTVRGRDTGRNKVAVPR